MKKSTKRRILLGIILCITGFIIFQVNFFFNPITFKRDEVTYLPWSWYKNPLVLEYLVDDGNHPGWKVYDVTDSAEIKYIFSELKRAPVVDYDISEQTYSIKRVYIRQYDPKAHGPENQKGTILLGVHFQDNHIARLKTDHDTHIEVTEEFIQFLEERWALAN